MSYYFKLMSDKYIIKLKVILLNYYISIILPILFCFAIS